MFFVVCSFLQTRMLISKIDCLCKKLSHDLGHNHAVRENRKDSFNVVEDSYYVNRLRKIIAVNSEVRLILNIIYD